MKEGKVISVMMYLTEVGDQYAEFVTGIIPKDIKDLGQVNTLVFKTEYPWRKGFLTAISQLKKVIQNIDDKEIPKYVLETILNQYQHYVENERIEQAKENFNEALSGDKTDAQ